MSDETEGAGAPTQEPRKRGWPKGKPRRVARESDTPLREPLRAKGDDRVMITRNGKTYEYISDDDNDRLKIDPSLIPDGMAYLWVTDSILGQPQPQWRARRSRTGWTPVPASRHDGMFMPKGYEGEINVDGLVLHEKPKEFVDRDKQKDRKNAAEQVWVRERQMMGGEIKGVAFDTQHKSVNNKVGKSYERIEIPD